MTEQEREDKLHIIIHLRSAAHRLFFFQNDLKAVAEVKIDGAAVALLYIQLYPPDGKGQEADYLVKGLIAQAKAY